MANVSSFVWLLAFQVSALEAPLQQKIDELIKARETAVDRAGLAAAIARVDDLEKRMLPIVFTFNRLAPVITQRTSEFAALEPWLADEKNQVDPYVDTGWMRAARKETAYVCCEVRRNSRLAHEIQENLARGLPALSDSTAEAVAARARQAVRGGGAIVEIADPEASPRRAPMPTPMKLPSAPPSKTGLSTGVISGLPQPSAPVSAPAPSPVQAPNSPPGVAIPPAAVPPPSPPPPPAP